MQAEFVGMEVRPYADPRPISHHEWRVESGNCMSVSLVAANATTSRDGARAVAGQHGLPVGDPRIDDADQDAFIQLILPLSYREKADHGLTAAPTAADLHGRSVAS